MNEEIMMDVPSLENATALEVAEAIAAVLDAKKGKDVKIIHVEEKTVIAEYFVLCTGNSSTQVKGLVGEVEYQLERRGVKPYNVEGKDNNSWILLDYSNIIVHVFSREAREFYNLDKLYGDSSSMSVSTED
ncbi:MAG: ribosome silencing factor [Clostridia bacterium]|nr:ribosome silencing factor [Clostridia bacterium]